LVGVFSGIKATRRQLLAGRALELELLAVSTSQLVLQRVEGQVARNGEGGDDLGGGDEGMGSRVAVIPLGEVPVVGGDDGVLDTLLHVLTLPLSDARTAGIAQHDATEFGEYIHLAISGGGGTNLIAYLLLLLCVC